MNAIEQAINIIQSISGLDINQRKLAIYYAIATWKMPDLQIFPILRFCGPSGTGKTSAMRTLAPWCRNPRRISGKLITSAALRDELKNAYKGTAIIEEADETDDINDTEQLLAARCSPATGTLNIKEQYIKGWQQLSIDIYGASIIHYRRALRDQATNSRTITIETQFRKGMYRPPEIVDENNLGIIFQKLGEAISVEDIFSNGTNRVYDIWRPILAVAKLVSDYDWIKWSRSRIQSQIEDLADGQAYEVTGTVFGQILRTLDKEGSIIPRQINIQEDIIEPLHRHRQIDLTPWQTSRQIRELGFKIERIGGQNKFTPTMESLKYVATKIGYKDELLK